MLFLQQNVSKYDASRMLSLDQSIKTKMIDAHYSSARVRLGFVVVVDVSPCTTLPNEGERMQGCTMPEGAGGLEQTALRGPRMP